MQKISIVIPAYNEEAHIDGLLRRVLEVDIQSLGFEKEILVVDDGSQDRTYEVAASFPAVKALRQVPNQGKGIAVQRGIRESTGDWVLVQDADLEYDPKDYRELLTPIKPGASMSIYGSRLQGQIKKSGRGLFPGKHPRQDLGPWLAGVFLTIWTAFLYGRWITDTLTAYKLYQTEQIRSFDVKTCGFETDHELTAKLIKAGTQIVEVPISYQPRTTAEGKKIRPKDGLVAVWTLLKFRFVD